MTDSNYGILLKKATVLVGEITNLGFPELITEAVEKTNHSSGGNREFISSKLSETGEFTFTMNVVQANLDIVDADRQAGTVANYQIEYPAALALDAWVFDAFPTNIAMQDSDAQSPDVLTADITFRPTGGITFSG